MSTGGGDRWEKGDLALCIRVGSWVTHGVGPQMGEIHPVTAVLGLHEVNVVPGTERENACFLEFAAWAPDNTFGCSSFIKVTPPKADQFDTEIIATLIGEPVTVGE